MRATDCESPACHTRRALGEGCDGCPMEVALSHTRGRAKEWSGPLYEAIWEYVRLHGGELKAGITAGAQREVGEKIEEAVAVAVRIALETDGTS